MKIPSFFILLAIAVFMVFGCESQSNNQAGITTTPTTQDPGTVTETPTASVSILINFDTQATTSLKNAIGTSSDIATITVEASDASTDSVLGTASLEKVDGIWQGALQGLPYNTDILFTASAVNSDATVIFTGTATKALVEGQANNIEIAMASIDDGIQPTNPKIVSATLPEKVLTDSEPQLISFAIEHSGDVDFTLEAVGGLVALNIDDTPTAMISGTHNPATSLEAYFFPASVAGQATITLTVKDVDSSDTVGASYFIDIISYDPETWTDTGISVIVGPAITDVVFKRTESTLQAKVITDPDSGLTYSWAGTGSFTGLNETGNPVFITDFSDDMAGEIAVTVTDSDNLEAFVTRTIHAGDFPYLVDGYVADMPGLYIYDDTTGLLWQDNTNEIFRKWDDADVYCQSLKLVDYSVWRLPTRNELANMFLRKDAFSYYTANNYWTADEQDRNFAYVVSFADGSESTDWKKRKNLVRCVKD